MDVEASVIWTLATPCDRQSRMESKPTKSATKKTPDNREDRLKAALKANLQRRKAQTRVRKAADQK
ncbi:MAG: hypothetical protein COB40_09200 [Marinosulfonomonas sp.]|nr:MAG: hypothetical protein COB40_09200 [Marinosulfonomonas sp.]